jgi:hypothetical protein
VAEDAGWCASGTGRYADVEHVCSSVTEVVLLASPVSEHVVSETAADLLDQKLAASSWSRGVPGWLRNTWTGQSRSMVCSSTTSV